MEHNQNDNDLLLDQFMISSYDDDDDDDDQTSTMVKYQAVDDDDQFLATNILDDHPNRNSLTINFQGFSVPNHDHNIPSGDHHGSSAAAAAAAATRSSSTSEDCATKFVAFRTKTQLETLDDGFKWRKYGKKKVKNTHNPRHYYKCSSGGCDVKKRVERDRDDSSVLITTYQAAADNQPIINDQ